MRTQTGSWKFFAVAALVVNCVMWFSNPAARAEKDGDASGPNVVKIDIPASIDPNTGETLNEVQVVQVTIRDENDVRNVQAFMRKEVAQAQRDLGEIREQDPNAELNIQVLRVLPPGLTEAEEKQSDVSISDLAEDVAAEHQAKGARLLETNLVSHAELNGIDENSPEFREQREKIAVVGEVASRPLVNTAAIIRGVGLFGSISLGLIFIKGMHPAMAATLAATSALMSRQLGRENSFMVRWLKRYSMPGMKTLGSYAQSEKPLAGLLRMIGAQHLEAIADREHSGRGLQHIKFWIMTYGYLAVLQGVFYATGMDAVLWSPETALNTAITATLGWANEGMWTNYNSSKVDAALNGVTRKYLESGDLSPENFETARQKSAQIFMWSAIGSVVLSISSTTVQVMGGGEGDIMTMVRVASYTTLGVMGVAGTIAYGWGTFKQVWNNFFARRTMNSTPAKPTEIKESVLAPKSDACFQLFQK